MEGGRPGPAPGAEGGALWLRLVAAMVLSLVTVPTLGGAVLLAIGGAAGADGAPGWPEAAGGVAALAVWSPILAWAGFVPGLPLAARRLRRGRSAGPWAGLAFGAGCGMAVAAALLALALLDDPRAATTSGGWLIGLTVPLALAGAVYGGVFSLWLRVVSTGGRRTGAR